MLYLERFFNNKVYFKNWRKLVVSSLWKMAYVSFLVVQGYFLHCLEIRTVFSSVIWPMFLLASPTEWQRGKPMGGVAETIADPVCGQGDLLEGRAWKGQTVGWGLCDSPLRRNCSEERESWPKPGACTRAKWVDVMGYNWWWVYHSSDLLESRVIWRQGDASIYDQRRVHPWYPVWIFMGSGIRSAIDT